MRSGLDIGWTLAVVRDFRSRKYDVLVKPTPFEKLVLCRQEGRQAPEPM